MKTFITIITILFLIIIPIASLGSEIQTTDLETSIAQKIAKHTDVSLKVTVTNNGAPAEIIVRAKALDANGFELVTASFNGKFNSLETKILTTTRMIKDDMFERITRWETSDAYAYPIK